jgi:Flp pilus assembly pilin Flp
MIYHPSEVIKNTMLEKPLKTCTALKEWAEEAQKNLFSRRLDESGTTMIDVAVTMAIGLIVLVAIFSLAPLIGSNIDSASAVPAESQWNSTTNENIPTGVGIWEQNAGLLMLAVMVSILSMIIWAIMRIRGSGGSGGI